MPEVSASTYTITVGVSEEHRHYHDTRSAGANFQIDASVVHDLLYGTNDQADLSLQAISAASGKAITEALRLLNSRSSTQVSESLTDEVI